MDGFKLDFVDKFIDICCCCFLMRYVFCVLWCVFLEIGFEEFFRLCDMLKGLVRRIWFLL